MTVWVVFHNRQLKGVFDSFEGADDYARSHPDNMGFRLVSKRMNEGEGW